MKVLFFFIYGGFYLVFSFYYFRAFYRFFILHLWHYKVIFKVLRELISFGIFIVRDHRLWLLVFVQSMDSDFADGKSKREFFKWLSWNFVHLELLFSYVHIFRVIFLLFLCAGYQLLEFFKKKYFLHFLLFFLHSNVSVFLSKRYIVMQIFQKIFLKNIWLFYLWWRTYFFIITRLDLNFIFWYILQPLHIRARQRGLE